MNCELNLARPLANSISPVPISAPLLYIGAKPTVLTGGKQLLISAIVIFSVKQLDMIQHAYILACSCYLSLHPSGSAHRL